MIPTGSPESQPAFGLDKQLCEDQLNLLYAEFGFAVDPRMDRDDTSLIFPWGVYEAKGWAGDCREARSQALAAGAAYLDMLDCLARTPDSSGYPTAYQTHESRNFQVFALTSYGAQWHINVGYRRPREKVDTECADWVHPVHVENGRVSDYVYIFQRVWSGRVVNQKRAYELLTLIDQIQDWATHKHRDFVTRHLVPWTRLGRRWQIDRVWTFDPDDERSSRQRVYSEDPQGEARRRSSHRSSMNINFLLAKYKGLNQATRFKLQAKADRIYDRRGGHGIDMKQRWKLLKKMIRQEAHRRCNSPYRARGRD
ncbi:uncharacterized protein BDZ99DRAFT_495668 [Mytilinidion resinicola]|uniref:Uncharacterized protein n=1 Tax=Mytilinidion resinicola TaxID=574789 RepID=A0A6A6YZ68_9PEZI|nr:uncharacterized protein BDZ99DRAFT_495668 [Mytilinidion resinicola]KAF2814121.1 hypothetical protein BDZ99DRAFT_495668 [Mytilinidion resinicola]